MAHPQPVAAGVASSTAASAERSAPLVVGMVVWLASELMFFAGLFAAWFTLRSANQPGWVPEDVELELWRAVVFTVVLLVSSITVHAAVRAAERDDRRAALGFLALTGLLGAAFLANLLVEYSQIELAFDASAFSTIFYLLTGFHGAHLAGGLVLMALVAYAVFSGEGAIRPAGPVQAAGFYWHFVDVVWVAVFLVIYVVR